jgi:F420-non-reducing hydrogenase iron-sulfur subunit
MPDVRIVRVMCTGSVDPAFILRAFSNGADGVFIGGCWPGECHYPTEGNYHALSITLLTRKLLEHIGVNPERLRIQWVSASEGIRFAELMNDVARKTRELGPLGRGEGIDANTMRFKLEAAKNLLPYLKLVERERLSVRFETEEEYSKFLAGEEGDRLFRELILDPLAISQMMLLLRENPLSVGEISVRLGLEPSEVTRHLHRSVRQGLIKFDESLKRFAPA